MDIKKFNIGDEVLVSGLDGAYTVESYFEQMMIAYGKEVFELWYTVKGKKDNDVREVSYQLVKSSVGFEQHMTNELLDEYNDYVRLNGIFGDREYIDRAEFILDKLKYKL
jgi:hypothetical protein